MENSATPDALKSRIRALGLAAGFDAVGFATATVAPEAQARLHDWLAAGFHGGMDYMARHAALRADPAALHAGTVSVITVRLNYLPPSGRAESDPETTLSDSHRAYISRYALGRDYHKTIRQRLAAFSEQLNLELASQYSGADRVFVDSAPVMEVEFARVAGLGWRGKHSLLLTREGSYYFLGEIYSRIPLPPDVPVESHCGSCRRCLDLCPTQAIVAPYRVDARRCISYLTIEHSGSIPEALRPLMGNRIYGCDDCQLVCPWNRFATPTREMDFLPRNRLDTATLAELANWSAADFETRLAGSPIRRIGHSNWQRNIAVALGNGSPTPEALKALRGLLASPSDLVREHATWAWDRLNAAPMPNAAFATSIPAPGAGKDESP